MVAEIDEGTACLDCGSGCEGFTRHEWKYVGGFRIINFNNFMKLFIFIEIFAIIAVVHANVMI
jgi:hypothetical protein